MTICIAALADKGQSCVIAADRQITYGFPTNIAFEHHESKIEPISKMSAIMSAGNALVAAEVVDHARRLIEKETLFHAAASLRDEYMKVHMERAEQLILRPRGLTLQEFKEGGTQKIPLPVYQAIDQLFWNFTLNTEFLIAGVDAEGGHIGWVHYHGMQGGGWLEWFDKLGHHAIGSGGSHAAILLSLGGQHKDVPVPQAVYNVYSAKVNAEVAPGVGSETDLAVINKEGIEFLSERFLGQLDDLRASFTKTRESPAKLERLFSERKNE